MNHFTWAASDLGENLIFQNFCNVKILRVLNSEGFENIEFCILKKCLIVLINSIDNVIDGVKMLYENDPF
jgi:hypothetical protein